MGRRAVALRSVVGALLPGALRPDPVVEDVERHEVVAVQERSVIGVDHVGVGLVRSHELELIGRQERVQCVEVRPTDAHGAAGLDAFRQSGRGCAEVEETVARLPRPGRDERAGVGRTTGEVRERCRDGGLRRERELLRRRPRQQRGARQIARDRDECEVAIHEHLDLVAEDLDIADLLREGRDDAARARVVQVAEGGRCDVGRLQPVEVGHEAEVATGRRLGGRANRGVGERRGVRGRALGPQHGRDIVARVHRLGRRDPEQCFVGRRARGERPRCRARALALGHVEFGARSGPYSGCHRGQHEERDRETATKVHEHDGGS